MQTIGSASFSNVTSGTSAQEKVSASVENTKVHPGALQLNFKINSASDATSTFQFNELVQASLTSSVPIGKYSIDAREEVTFRQMFAGLVRDYLATGQTFTAGNRYTLKRYVPYFSNSLSDAVTKTKTLTFTTAGNITTGPPVTVLNTGLNGANTRTLFDSYDTTMQTYSATGLGFSTINSAFGTYSKPTATADTICGFYATSSNFGHNSTPFWSAPTVSATPAPGTWAASYSPFGSYPLTINMLKLALSTNSLETFGNITHSASTLKVGAFPSGDHGLTFSGPTLDATESNVVELNGLIYLSVHEISFQFTVTSAISLGCLPDVTDSTGATSATVLMTKQELADFFAGTHVDTTTQTTVHNGDKWTFDFNTAIGATTGAPLVVSVKPVTCDIDRVYIAARSDQTNLMQ